MNVNFDPSILVDNIKKACELRSTSVYAVNKALGYHNGIIYKQWRKSKPSWDKVLAIAKYLDVSVDFLVGNTDTPEPYKTSDDKPKEPLNIMTDDDTLPLWSMGKKIAQLRKKQGLTSGQLAELCGIKPAYLRQIECGRGTPSLPLFITLCRLLGTSADYLIGSVPQKADSEAMDVLLEKVKYLPPDQIQLFIHLADVILAHLSKNEK